MAGEPEPPGVRNADSLDAHGEVMAQAAPPRKQGLAREVGFSLQSIAMAVALVAALAFGLPWLIGLVWK